MQNQKATLTAASRLGKKQLRRLRHQQAVLPPREFLWASAQKMAANGHAHIVGASKEFEVGDNEAFAPGDSGQADCPESIRVVTTSDWNSSRIQEILNTQPSDPGRTAATILVRPLLVLDLNGILCHRIRRGRPPPPAHYREAVTTVANTPIIPRSDLIPFLRMLQRHFSLAIWTSAKAKTASQLLNKLLPPELASTFLFVYAQHHCRSIPSGDTNPSAPAHETDGSGGASNRSQVGWDEYEKPVFEKDLSVVWESFPLWNANNTVLYDDSPEKCLQWQSNAIHPPPLTGTHLDDPVQEQQAALLRQLAEHWTNDPGVLVWEADGGDSIWFRSSHQSRWLRDEVQKLRWDSSA